MIKIDVNIEPISVLEINQLRKENERLTNELAYFIQKYMGVRSLLTEGLQIIEHCEEQLQHLEDKLFWADETRRLYNEGWSCRDALEIVKLEENIQKFLRRKGVI